MENDKENYDFDETSIPNFYLSDLLYKLQLNISIEEKNETMKILMKKIEENNMYPYYKYICDQLNIPLDQKKYNELKLRSDQELNEIDQSIQEESDNYNSVDTKNIILMKANYYCKICDKDQSYNYYEQAYNKGIGIGAILDILLTLIRVAIFFNDIKNIKKFLELAKIQMEKGGDWERKNKLKIYEALYFIIIRKFCDASKILIDASSTFTATEIISYDKLILYVVILSIITEERTTINKKVLNNSAILQVTSSDEDLFLYVHSFYHCNYKTFFEKIIKISKRVKEDKYLGKHYKYFLRHTRVRAYRQFLEPFKTVTLKNMGYAFGVSEQFIENEISTFIANAKLNCKIDKVSSSIESNQPNERNMLYADTIKKGDILLNRIQKLSRVIDM